MNFLGQFAYPNGSTAAAAAAAAAAAGEVLQSAEAEREWTYRYLPLQKSDKLWLIDSD
jgi:hypothetical protein